MTDTKKTNRKLIIGITALVLLIVVFAAVFLLFRPKTVQGAKSITIEVVDNNAASTIYDLHTDAEYLRQAMEQAEGLEFSGTESEYGMMVETVNGVTADWTVDQADWGGYVNGD